MITKWKGLDLQEKSLVIGMSLSVAFFLFMSAAKYI